MLSRGFGYDFGPRIYPREGPQRSVLLFDVFSRPHLGEDCCSVARVAVSRRCRSGSFPCSPQFFLLCSPSFIDRDSVPVFVFDLAQLLDEPVDTAVARHRA